MAIKKNYAAEFKAMAAIEGIKGKKGNAEICSEYKIPGTNLQIWKEKALDNMYQIFIPESEYAKQKRASDEEITNLLLSRDIKISMDHKGRCFDNIYVERLWRTLKQEVIYYYRPEDIGSLERRIEEFVPWYNNKRLHQSLGYKTPAAIYLGNEVVE